MHNNAASRRPSVYAVACDEDEFGNLSTCSKERATVAPKAFIGCALIGAGCGDRLAW